MPEETTKGHKNRTPKNLRSAKTKDANVPISKNINLFPQVHEITNWKILAQIKKRQPIYNGGICL